MVNCFSFDGNHYLYDVESGSLHLCDELSFFVMSELIKNGGKTLMGVSAGDAAFSSLDADREHIAESIDSLRELENEGLLFCAAPAVSMPEKAGAVKSLCLNISYDCNFACKYCFAGGGDYGSDACGSAGMSACENVKNMPFSVARAAVDFLIRESGDIKNLEVDFFGGEPLMNFEVVKQTVEYAEAEVTKRGKSIKFTLTTNGLLLDDRAIDYLNEKMDNVVLSLDGRPDVHNAMRKSKNGKDTFDLVLPRFQKFRSVRGDKSYYIRGTFTAKNLDFADDVLFMNDCGFDQVSVEPVVTSMTELEIKKSHLPAVYAEYERLAREYIKRRKKDESWFNFFHFMLDLENAPCLKKRLTGCGAGANYLAVTPSGELYPCHQFCEKKEYLVGDVFGGIKNSELRDRFARSNALSKKKCSECPAKYFCSGGCKANNIFYSDGIDEPYDISCLMMRKRFELALAVYAEEHCKTE